MKKKKCNTSWSSNDSHGTAVIWLSEPKLTFSTTLLWRIWVNKIAEKKSLSWEVKAYTFFCLFFCVVMLYHDLWYHVTLAFRDMLLVFTYSLNWLHTRMWCGQRYTRPTSRPQLQKSQGTFLQLGNGSPQETWITDLNGCTGHCTDQATHIF